MTKTANTSYRILIVEDEVLIADTIDRYLSRNGHEVIGKAISYEEAVAYYEKGRPDLVLIDIRLSGSRSGIDLANYIINRPDPAPFIYLTSQTDGTTLGVAKDTFPASYLSKPIQADTLLATIAVVMHNLEQPSASARMVTLFDGRTHHRLRLTDIAYLRADHVYVQVALTGRPPILLRRTLTDLLTELGKDLFIQTHRSYAVNRQLVTRYDKEHVFIGEQPIPLSRSQRKKIHKLL
jgi:DNA-binding LytR/AlgR family response regulator